MEEPKEVCSIEGITEYRFDNGVQLLLLPDNTKPQFTLVVTVLVGSRHEGYGEMGMAHLLEHMLYKGTDSFPEIPKELNKRGVLNLNGSTAKDRTNFYEVLPSSDENLEFAIHMESDRLLNSWIKEEHLASEMSVVRSEFEMGENSPHKILQQRIVSCAYDWHNYRNAIIGNRRDIENVPVERLKKFYKHHYQPDNIMVVISGKFNIEKSLKLMSKYFGSLKKPERKLFSTYTEEPTQDGERKVILRRSGNVHLVGCAYHIPSISNSDFPAIQVLELLLQMKPNGFLYKELVEKKYSSGISVVAAPSYDPGLLITLCELPKDEDINLFEEKLLNILENTDNLPINDENVNRAVKQILQKEERLFIDSSSFAISLSSWRSYGDWRLYFLHRDRLKKVTSDDVKKVAKKYLIPSNRTIGHFIPTENPIRTEISNDNDISSLLENYKGGDSILCGEDFDPTPENIDNRTIHGKLSSGIKYALLPKETRGGKVYGFGSIHFGDENNLKKYISAIKLLPQLMLKGTKKLSFQEYQDKLDELDTVLNLSGELGTLSFGFQTQNEHLKEVLDILYQVLREPLLKENELDILKQSVITRIESSLSEPTSLAQRELQRKLYPYEKDNIQYSHTFEEEIELYKNLKYEDIITLHNEFLNGENGELTIVGDHDPDKTIPLLNNIFDNWKSTKNFKKIETIVNPEWKNNEKHTIINTPDKANCMYIAGSIYELMDTSPEYEALLIGNYLLGGGALSSRLSDNVRTKQGLSYAVGSQFRADHEDCVASFLVYAIANPENTPKVIESIKETIDTFLNEGPSESELNSAIDSYLKLRKGNRASDTDLASLLLKNLSIDRTMKHYAESDKKISELTVDKVKDAIRQYFQTDSLIGITAGDFDSIKMK